ncbi:interleukin-12 receptor subunit beta-2 isoform X2 [Corvus kubaryi]|uniref:interleukin-12 receptor subunit beta-2 isoform X2 n=1 Tax=Corvus kubaryi TaxID=68294 RepID=UPI001C0440F5|nr:interleukin-12 receptor subunit beta-2 isoform X2 [Corvus kubaryi]
MPFAWIVPSAIWLVLHFTAESCRKGAVGASRAVRGTVGVCGNGNVTANTACAIRQGTNVTLSCQLGALQGAAPCWAAIFLNNSEQVRNQGGSVSKTFAVTTYGKHTFTCKTLCGDKTRLVCGIDIQCGNPPDEPRNVSCIQHGTRGHLTCTWDKGRLTYLDTAYGIELSNGTDTFCFPEETPSQVFGSRALSKLDFDSNYTVVVSASNKLGNASSQPLTFMLIDIVKPHPPAFSVEFDDSSATNCTFSWHDEAQAQHYRLRYRPLSRHTWSVALSKPEAGGRILGYTVTLEALDHGKLPAQSHQTTQTSFSRVTPRVGHRITVSAHNSRGSSPPVAILARPGSQDLPPPQRVSAVALGNSSILVSWSPPLGSAVSVGGYVVEWEEPWREPRLRPQHSWVKLPPSHLSTVLAEHIRDNVCYQIHVSALYQDRAGQAASVRGNSTAQAPSAGPQMLTTPWASGILVSWEEIPAPQQRGCITGYHIYLQRRDRQGQPEVHAVPAGKAPCSLHIPDLEPGEHHDLWMTAVTAAGEGPRGNSDSVCLESAGGWVTLVLICSFCSFFILSACVCSVPPVRKVFQALFSLLLPQWQSKAIPDPANATWARSLTATKAELSAPSSPFLPSGFEEPETTPVEETFAHPEPPVPGDKLLVGSAGSRGHGDWAQESSGEEQQLPELYQRLVAEAMEPPEPVSEYISNPGTSALSPEPDTAPDPPEPDCSPLSVFPTTFLTPALCCEGNLTLDRVKLNCSSFPSVSAQPVQSVTRDASK